LKGPLLALLLAEPGYPSQLAGRLSELVGPAWGVETDDAYSIMERFEKLGLASSTRRIGSRPHQVVIEYQATELTARAVEEWMASPLPKEPIRTELWARIAVARPEDAPHILRALEEYEQARLDLMSECTKELGVRSWAELKVELARLGVALEIESDLKWADYARGGIEERTGVRDPAEVISWLGAQARGEKWRTWRRGSSLLKGPLLALLLVEPGYPSQLVGRLSKRVGSAWGVDARDAYSIMERFEKLGLASSTRRIDHQKGDPREPHQVVIEYQATELTAKAVEQWIQSPLPRGPIREELWTRIAVSRPENAPHILRMLEEYEHARLEQLREYTKELPVQSWRALVIELVRKGMVLKIEGDLEWVDKARGRIEELVGTQGV
jgi:DNA-binding PadR family transcriptional regulator